MQEKLENVEIYELTFFKHHIFSVGGVIRTSTYVIYAKCRYFLTWKKENQSKTNWKMTQ